LISLRFGSFRKSSQSLEFQSGKKLTILADRTVMLQRRPEQPFMKVKSAGEVIGNPHL
jgi:hypothetical protein